MKRNLIAMLLLAVMIALSASLPAYSQEAAPDYNQIIKSTKIYDVIITPWTRAKKDEVVTAVEMGKAVADFESMSWTNVVGKYNAYKKIAEKKKAYTAACKTRVEIEKGLEQAGITDMGQKVYRMLLTGTDYLARLNNDGPIFSDLIKSYDNMVTSLVEYDNSSWWSPFSKLRKAKDLKNTMKSTYQSADRFMKSNTYNRIEQIVKMITGAVGKPISGVEINTQTVGGVVDIIKNAKDIYETIGGIFNFAPAQDGGRPANAGNVSEGAQRSAAIAGQAAVTGDAPALSGSQSGQVDARMKRYNDLMRYYVEQVKNGADTKSLDPVLDEIRTLKKELGQ